MATYTSSFLPVIPEQYKFLSFHEIFRCRIFSSVCHFLGSIHPQTQTIMVKLAYFCLLLTHTHTRAEESVNHKMYLTALTLKVGTVATEQQLNGGVFHIFQNRMLFSDFFCLALPNTKEPQNHQLCEPLYPVTHPTKADWLNARVALLGSDPRGERGRTLKVRQQSKNSAAWCNR